MNIRLMIRTKAGYYRTGEVTLYNPNDSSKLFENNKYYILAHGLFFDVLNSESDAPDRIVFEARIDDKFIVKELHLKSESNSWINYNAKWTDFYESCLSNYFMNSADTEDNQECVCVDSSSLIGGCGTCKKCKKDTE